MANIKKTEFKAHSLTGIRFEVRDLSSIAHAMREQNTVRGIYRLTFDDGEKYAGQTVNIVSRFASHRRRWADITSLEFFPIAVGDLNTAERALIADTESHSDVRNIKDTQLPRGSKDWPFTSEEGNTALLPWERTRRPRIQHSTLSQEQEKFLALAKHPEYERIAFIAATYIVQTIPDPLSTQRYLWTVSCLPRTNRQRGYQRLLTLSCGNLETLIIDERSEDPGSPEIQVHINSNAPEPGSDLDELNNDCVLVVPFDYRKASVLRWSFTLAGIEELLFGSLDFPHEDLLWDQAYQLNVQLMRSGSTMFGRFHSQPLAKNLLEIATILDLTTP